MSKLSLPEKKRNIVLVGHMGSGKTTVGKELAKRTQLKFYDIDKEIEKIAKKTINKIFEHDGEAKFEIRRKSFYANFRNEGICNCIGRRSISIKCN